MLYQLFELYGPEDADVAAKEPVIPVASHVLTQINLRGTVGTTDGAAHPGLGCSAPGVGPQVPLKSLLYGTRIRAQRAPVFFSFVPIKINHLLKSFFCL